MRNLVARLGVLACVMAVTGCASDTQVAPVACDLAGPTVSPPSSTMSVGDTLRLHVAPLFDCMNRGPYVAVWHSSNVAVATVDSVSGLVTARSVGMATIVAAAIYDPAVAGASVVQVK